ncbi:MAG: IS1/IS1595 family N-terminal zinc-binding domain-containing protein [Candidatus Pacearchaeota archaeon]
MINCIHCSSSNCVLNGHDKKGVQRYKCNDCHRRFCEKGVFARFRTDKQFILNCLYLRSHTLSLREVKRISRKFFGIKRSHVSIYNWIMKFAPHLTKIERKMPLNFTDIWHLEEKFIHVKRSKDRHAYLYVVADSVNNVIATLVANSRTTANAKIVLKKSKRKSQVCSCLHNNRWLRDLQKSL